MTGPAGPAPQPRRDARRGWLVAGLVVAVLLLVGSVAVVGWSGGSWGRDVQARWYGEQAAPDGTDDGVAGMERMHDRMHGPDTGQETPGSSWHQVPMLPPSAPSPPAATS